MPFKPPRSANLLLQWALPAEDLEVDRRRSRGDRSYGSRAARRRCRRAPLVLAAGPQHRVRAGCASPRPSHRITRRGCSWQRSDRTFPTRRGFFANSRHSPRWPSPCWRSASARPSRFFALVNAVILKPLPFEDPDRLMLVHLLSPARDAGEPRPMIWSYPKYQVFRDHQRAFDRRLRARPGTGISPAPVCPSASMARWWTRAIFRCFA